ncbi:MAG: HNH endonuclease [Anaerolineae bacterium]|jgi:putative restriction endonuclease
MNFYVGVTDNDWFRFLAQRQPDEVNFWRPGGGSFRAIQPWEPLLFKLHSPYDYIVGGGFFVTYSRLPLSVAWEAFGPKNGAPNFRTFYEQIRQYREPRGTMRPDPDIGCIVLAQPFFFEKNNWIPMPEDWHPNIVQGKRYDAEEPIGAAVWNEVQMRLEGLTIEPAKEPVPAGVNERPRYGEEYTVRRRLGQGAFRVTVTEAYGRRCAMTGERTLPVLQASHIKPYSESGPHRVDNGLLLRADLHILFDHGYMTLTRDYRMEASRRIKEEFENGEEYYEMHGKRLQMLPLSARDRPSAEFIDWHNENVFAP